MEYGVKGRYRIEVTRGDTGNVEVYDVDNLITNRGMNRFGEMQDRFTQWVDFLHIGSGSTTPQFTDTVLASWVASSATSRPAGNIGVWDAGKGCYTGSWLSAFAQGAVVGNMTELGAGPGGASTDPLCSRALIKDGSGNPTVLTLTSIDQVTVTYQLYIFPPAADVVSTTTIGGVSTTVTSRAANVGANTDGPFGRPVGDPQGGGIVSAYSGDIAGTGGAPTGNLGNASVGQTVPTYTPGTYTLQWTKSFPVDQANGTVRSIYMYTGMGYYQIGFSPGIVKDNTKTLTFTMEASWARKV